MAASTHQSPGSITPPVAPVPLSQHLNAENPLPFPGQQTRSGRRGLEFLLTATEVAADLVSLLVSLGLSYAVFKRSSPNVTQEAAAAAICVVVAVALIFFERGGSYSLGCSLLRIRETERVLRGWCQTLLICAPLVLVLEGLSRKGLLLVAVFVPLVLILEKSVLYFAIRRLYAHGYGIRNAVIYGAGLTGRRIFSSLSRSPKLGIHPVAFIDDNPSRAAHLVYEASYKRRQSAPVIKGPLTVELLRSVNAKVLIIGIPSISAEKLKAARNAATSAGCVLCIAPFDFAPGQRAEVDGTLLVMCQARVATAQALKRVVDLAVAAVSLVVLSPLFFAASVIVRCTSRGPALFLQERVGIHGELFRMYKFRSMYVDAAPYEYSPDTIRDPRITKFGRFLRRTSLDELPQLINVLKGDMSLVGPRPEMPFIVEHYNELQRYRLRVKPGITGLWQLSADRAFQIHENLEYDLYYIRNRTFFMDIAILLHTLVFAARGI